MTRRSVAALAAAGMLAVAGALLVNVADASEGPNPQVVARLDAIRPALPPGVVLQAEVSLDDQLVAANPTAVELAVVGTDGRPFLRISRMGVFANLAEPDWYESNVPGGGAAIPAGVRSGAAARWARVSGGDAWGWFDARVASTDAVVPPGALAATAPVAFQSWTVPLRYGSTAVAATGHFVYYPLVGSLVDTVTSAPAVLSAVVLQGRLPGILASDPTGAAVTVIGVDGLPFLRFGPAGVAVNVASRSWALDRQARGLPVPTAAANPTWRTLTSARSADWLDPRLRYPAAQPVDVARAGPVGAWTVPLRIDGRPAVLSGVIDWQPGSAALQAVSPRAAARHSGYSVSTIVGSTVASALLATALVLWWRRRVGRA